jgi:hypothetical protein
VKDGGSESKKVVVYENVDLRGICKPRGGANPSGHIKRRADRWLMSFVVLGSSERGLSYVRFQGQVQVHVQVSVQTRSYLAVASPPPHPPSRCDTTCLTHHGRLPSSLLLVLSSHMPTQPRSLSIHPLGLPERQLSEESPGMSSAFHVSSEETQLLHSLVPWLTSHHVHVTRPHIAAASSETGQPQRHNQ